MSLPPPQGRRPLHTRAVTYRGYLRDDGLWEIEAELCDTKDYVLHLPGHLPLPAHAPIHDMLIRVALDDAMTVREIAAAMRSTPFPECQQARDPLQKMIGATMGPGWRKAIETHLGGITSCTHLRELLFNMATAAYQTIPVYLKQFATPHRTAGDAPVAPPLHFGKCLAWDFNGPVVQRHAPEFFAWQAPDKALPRN